MKKLSLVPSALTVLLFFSGLLVNAQGGVAINNVGAAPDNSAAFDVSFNNKGLLMPRMSTTQRNNIANPATGLTIYNTDCNVYNYNAGTPGSPNWATMAASNVVVAGVSITVYPLGGICAGGGATFSATPAGGITDPHYQWQVNGQNVGTDSSLYTASTLNNGDVVKCILTSNQACIVGSPATSNAITMSIAPGPSTPGAITVSASPCPNSAGNVFSVSPANNTTSYTWSVPNGATITAGAGTNSITVTWGTNSGTVGVVANNACASSSQTTVTVNTNTAPATPGSITGPNTLNQNATVTYSISPVQNATSYTWTVSTGNIISGQGSDSISVSWGNSSDFATVSVVANNACGSSSAQTLSVGVQSQTFNYTGGTQSFTIPNGVSSVTIEAWGGQGGNSSYNSGGLGADIKGTFNVNPGDVLSIGVGGQAAQNNNSGGGGGSSGVKDGGTLLIVAGGGGGAGEGNVYYGAANINAVAGTSGQSTYGCNGGTGTLLGTGGTNGSGGGAGTNPCGDWPQGSGGAGVYSNGASADGGSNGPCSGGLTSGAGGSGDNINGGGNGAWGFTGGGGASYGGGGGGGYSGGAGGASSPAPYYVAGGGGGSYNGGSNQSNTGGVQSGNGQVIITW